MTSPTMRKNYLYTVVTQVVSMLTPLVTAPYLARVLGEEGVGSYSYVLSVATTFSLFAVLGLNAYGMREVSRVRDDPEAVRRLFWELNRLRWMATLMVTAVYGLLVWWSDRWHLWGAMGMLIVATGLDPTWFFQAVERFGALMFRQLVVKGMAVALVFLLVRGGGDVATYAAIQAGSALLANGTMWLSLRGRMMPPPGKLHPWRHLRPSMVYFVPAIATSVYTVLDKTMLGLIAGDMAQNGYYESAHKILHLLLAVVASLNAVVGVRTSYLFGQRRVEEARRHVLDAYRFMCALAFPLCGGVIACGRNFSILFFGESFAPAGGMLMLFAPLLFLIGTSNVLGSLYLTPAGYRRLSNRAILTGAGVNVLLNVLWIPRLGGYGAVAASLAAEGVIAVLYLHFSHAFVPAWRLLHMAARYALYGGGVWAVAAVVGYGRSPAFSTFAWQTVAGVVMYILLLLLFRDPVWQVWKNLRKEGEGA